MSQKLFGGAGAHDLATGSPVYFNLTGGARQIGLDVEQVISTPGTIKNLRVYLSGPPGAGNTYTFILLTRATMDAAFVETALQCAITGAVDTDGQDLVNEIAVAAGITVAIQETPDSTPTARRGYWTVEFVPDTTDDTLILGNTYLEDWGQDYWVPFASGLDITAGFLEERVEAIIPTPGTIKNLFAAVRAALWGAGDNWTYKARKNRADTLLTVNVAFPAYVASDLVNSFAVAAGDRVALKIADGGQQSTEAYHGLTFVPDTLGESILLGCMAYAKDDTDTEYAHLIPLHHLQAGYGWSTTESDKQLLAQSCIFRNLYVDVTVAPGAGKSFLYTLMVNGAPSLLTCTIADAATTANLTGTDITINDDDLLSLRVEPVNTPNVTGIHRWGMVSYSPGIIGWGEYLELTHAAIICESVSFKALYNAADINSIDIDVYDTEWRDVYEGTFTDQVLTSKDLDQQRTITKARVRFYNSSNSSADARLYDFQFFPRAGIPSAEAFGLLAISQTWAITIGGAGIASTEAFGNPTITTTVTIDVGGTGIASSEAFGLPRVAGPISIGGVGIASTEAFGYPLVKSQTIVFADSITSQEAFGLPVVAGPIILISIVSAEAFGYPSILPGTVTIQPISIASSEAFGYPTIARGTVTIYPTSISSTEAFGALKIQLYVQPISIASAEAFGNPAIQHALLTIKWPASIASAEAFGLPAILRGTATVAPTSIASTEAFSSPAILPGTVTIVGISIVSAEAFGLPALTIYIQPISIVSTEAFGYPAVLPGTATVVVDSIASAEAFGNPQIWLELLIYADSVLSAEAFGYPTIKGALQTITWPTSIASSEAFGLPKVAGPITIGGTGIASSEAFGYPNIAPAVTVVVSSVSSAEAFGLLTVLVGAKPIALISIDSAEAFGFPTVIRFGVVFIYPLSIGTAETVNPINIYSGVHQWRDIEDVITRRELVSAGRWRKIS